MLNTKNTINNIQFFNVDCLEFMRGVPDKFYDLAMVDPPYGIGQDINMVRNDGKWGYKKRDKTDWDFSVPPTEYFTELRRISINQIIWGGNYFELNPTSCLIIWDKVQRIDQADCEIAWTSFKTAARIFSYARGNESGFAPMLKKSEKQFANIHPTQKPIALYRWLLQNYAKTGDRIFDSHGGSMSSAIACDMEGYELDICELDKDYFDAGYARFMDYYTKKTEIAELGYARTALNKIQPTLF